MFKNIMPLCIVGLCIAGCNSGQETAPEPSNPALKPAKVIFEARCSQCHSISRPLGKHKTSIEWDKTVSRMQQKAQGKISDADVEKIVAYLEEVRGPEK